MHSYSNAFQIKSFWRRTLLIGLLLITAAISGESRTAAAADLVLWDTMSAVGDDLDTRANWKAVPTDLFALEKNPPKASSDPGYYGREYAFKGDAVIENEKLLALFSSVKGNMVLYTKTTGTGTGGAVSRTKISEITPLQEKPGGVTHFGIVRNAGGEVVLEVSKGDTASGESSATFSGPTSWSAQSRSRST